MYSRVTYTADGVTKDYTVSFPYLSVSTLEVRVDSVLQLLGINYTVDQSTSKVSLVLAPAALTPISIKRVTPRGTDDRLVVFHDPSDLNAVTLNRSALQLLFIVQEALDDIAQGVGVNTGESGTGIPPAIQDELTDIATDLNNALAQANDALVAEVDARTSALLTEHNAWVAAVLAEATNRDAAILTAKTTLQTADSALASQLSVINAAVNDSTTGLASAHSRITAEQTARAAADTATASQLSTLSSSTAGINSRLTSVEGTLASGATTEALAFRTSALESTVNTPTTGLVARMSAEEATRANGYSALATRTSTLESTATSHGNSITANTAAIASEATTRASADSALSGTISSVSAAASSALTQITSEVAARASADTALGTRVDGVVSSVGALTASVSTEASTRATQTGNLSAQWVLKVGAGNAVTGMRVTSTSNPAAGDTSEIAFSTGAFKVFNGTTADPVFYVEGGVCYLNLARIKNASIDGAKIASLAVDTLHVKGNAITATVKFSAGSQTFLKNVTKQVAKGTIVATGGGIKVDLKLNVAFGTGGSARVTVYRGTTLIDQFHFTRTHANFESLSWFCTDAPAAGTYTYYIYVEGANDNGTADGIRGTIEETKK